MSSDPKDSWLSDQRLWIQATIIKDFVTNTKDFANINNRLLCVLPLPSLNSQAINPNRKYETTIHYYFLQIIPLCLTNDL